MMVRNNKIVKRIQYLNESMISQITNDILEKTKAQEKKINLQDLPFKRNNSTDDPEIIILSTSTSNFKVKFKISKNFLKDYASKLPKVS